MWSSLCVGGSDKKGVEPVGNLRASVLDAEHRSVRSASAQDAAVSPDDTQSVRLRSDIAGSAWSESISVYCYCDGDCDCGDYDCYYYDDDYDDDDYNDDDDYDHDYDDDD